MTYNRQSGSERHHTNFTPALKPALTRSNFAAPIFWEAKLETPFASVVNDVITRLLSLTPAEYPAITPVPNPLMTFWITILPIDMKLCCKILGIAIIMNCTKMLLLNM